MILDTDQQIQESILDSLPITTETLKELGWKYISSSSYYYGHGKYVYWTIWKRGSYDYIERYEDGRCYFKCFRDTTGIRVSTIGELKQLIQSRQKEERREPLSSNC